MLRMELAPGGLQRLRLTLTRGDLLGCNVLPGFISLSRPSCAMIVLSTHLSNKREIPMKTGSLIALLFAGTIFAMVPISPQLTSRGVAVNIDTAQAITYGHARRVNRRMDRREFRQTRRAVRRGATID